MHLPLKRLSHAYYPRLTLVAIVALCGFLTGTVKGAEPPSDADQTKPPATAPSPQTPPSAAPTTSPPVTIPPAPLSAQALVEAAIDAYNRHDVEGFLKLHSESLVTAAPAAQPLQGLTAFRQALPQEWEAFPDAKIEVKRIIGGDYLVAVESIWEGTYQKTIPGLVAATGQTVRLSQMGIYTVKDQKITTLRSYYDPADLVRQLKGTAKSASAQAPIRTKRARPTAGRPAYPARRNVRRYTPARPVYRPRGVARRTRGVMRRYIRPKTYWRPRYIPYRR
jgi:steroid delta-isomerase-like uncharacterized protein